MEAYYIDLDMFDTVYRNIVIYGEVDDGSVITDPSEHLRHKESIHSYGVYDGVHDWLDLHKLSVL